MLVIQNPSFTYLWFGRFNRHSGFSGFNRISSVSRFGVPGPYLAYIVQAVLYSIYDTMARVEKINLNGVKHILVSLVSVDPDGLQSNQ